MRKLLHLSWSLFGIAGLAGCANYDVKVDAVSPRLSTYQASAGHVNSPAFEVGDIVELDPKTHDLSKAGRVSVPGTSIAFTSAVQQTSEPYAAPVELTYSQKINPAMQEEVAADVQHKTVLHVQSAWTRQLKKPDLFVAGSDELAKAANKLAAQHPDHQFFLVSAVSPADKVYLSYDGADSNATNSGRYHFYLNYSQNEQLAKLAASQPVFFKLTALAIRPGDGRAVVRAAPQAGNDPAEYHLQGAVAATW